VTDLVFAVGGVRVEPHAATPTLLFGLRIEERSGLPIDALALRCQIRIEPQRRRYDAAEAASLLELFGEPARWGDTVKPFLWTHVTTLVRAFTGSVELDLAVPCTYDFDVAAAKYLHALADGDISLLFLFSGTIFARGPAGLSVGQVPWDREARCALPVRTWREMMDRYFPHGGWLRLQRETIDALLRFKAREALATFDDVVAALLAHVEGRAA